MPESLMGVPDRIPGVNDWSKFRWEWLEEAPVVGMAALQPLKESLVDMPEEFPGGNA